MLPSPVKSLTCIRLAYLIFTSGSTGKPKAVMIRHKSALNVVRIWGRYVGLTAGDRFAQVASMSWDVHVIEALEKQKLHPQHSPTRPNGLDIKFLKP